MATGDVSKRIRSNIQRRLKSHGQDIDEALPDAIYSACDIVQNRIAEDTLCLQDKENISVFAGQETYDFPALMISERKLVTDGTLPLEKISMDKVEKLTLSRNNEDTVSSDDLMFYYKWNDKFGFLGSNGTIPSADFTVTVYHWRFLDDSEKMSDTVDPVVGRRWNLAIEFGALADLTRDPKWVASYEAEMQRVGSKELSNRSEILNVENDRSYD
jgi:hypothetical protein